MIPNAAVHSHSYIPPDVCVSAALLNSSAADTFPYKSVRACSGFGSVAFRPFGPSWMPENTMATSIAQRVRDRKLCAKRK